MKGKQNLNSIASFSGPNEFLSNFYESLIEYEGISYPTIEHAFQAAKTLDVKQRQLISIMDTPGQAKRAGRILTLRKDWEEIKFGVMTELVVLKFKDMDLRQKLLDTHLLHLEEGNNWHDNIWGVCSCDKCKSTGKNSLGTILMSVRSLIRSGLL